MIESAFKGTVSFLSQHFELIMAVNIGLFVYYVLVLIFLRLTDRSLRLYIRNVLSSSLYSSFFAGQMLILALMIYLYWYNYLRPADHLVIPGDVAFHTYWARTQQEIYFIDGNDLLVTQANGENRAYVYEGQEPLKEYHFSPDGRYILILSTRRLVLLDRQSKAIREIDRLEAAPAETARGTLSGVRWAKDSRKFAYEVSRWSSIASQDHVYVYFIEEAAKRAVQSPTRRISYLYWDESAENLYYLKHETEDRAAIHQVKVLRIPLTTMVPELVTAIPYEEASVPLINLELRGIRLFTKGDLLSFGGPVAKDQWVSADGRQVGIDRDDNFYYIDDKWFRQRLFKVRRRPSPQEGEIKRYQYQGGELSIANIRWLPGGRYVVMEHADLGILLLDPVKNKLGHLMEKRGHSYGWFVDIDRYHIPETVFENEALESQNKSKRSLSFLPR